MDSSLRIVVAGLVGTYPLGGMFWHYMQFVLGLHQLGHDVLYLEDTGRWCYDPHQMTFVESGDKNAAYIGREIACLDPALTDSWHFRDSVGTTFGKSWRDVREFCRTADLFINMSASALLRDEYRACRRLAFIDTDPMYTQANIPAYLAGTLDDKSRQAVETLLVYDRLFSYGENIGGTDCLVPSDLVHWVAIRQPVVFDRFAPHRIDVADRRRCLTTVASWEPEQSVTKVRDELYYGKGHEFTKLMALPEASALPLELALSGVVPSGALSQHGWIVRDGHSVSLDPWTYRNYLANSIGEWSVAKHGYVASRSGWFSCRTATYLALGVPAVVQDTGNPIPTGTGLHSFSNAEQAAVAIDRIASDPQRESVAAAEIAASYFDSRTVLSRMLAEALDA